MTCHQHLTFPPSCHNLLYLRPSNSPHFSFVTDEDLWGRNVLHIDPIATCSLGTYHLFTLHRSMSLYQITYKCVLTRAVSGSMDTTHSSVKSLLLRLSSLCNRVGGAGGEAGWVGQGEGQGGCEMTNCICSLSHC